MKGCDYMALEYKINVLDELKFKGYNTNKIRKEKIFGESTLQKLRNNNPISWETLEKLCELLQCQPSDLIEYKRECDTN